MAAVEYDISSGIAHATQPVSTAKPLPTALYNEAGDRLGETGSPVAVSQAFAPAVANQSVAYTGTAGTSAAVNASANYVIVTLTTDGYIAIGSAPTATTGDMFLPAFVPSPPLRVTGSTSKVSAIRDSVSGTMKIAEFS